MMEWHRWRWLDSHQRTETPFVEKTLYGGLKAGTKCRNSCRPWRSPDNNVFFLQWWQQPSKQCEKICFSPPEETVSSISTCLRISSVKARLDVRFLSILFIKKIEKSFCWLDTSCFRILWSDHRVRHMFKIYAPQFNTLLHNTIQYTTMQYNNPPCSS